MLGRFDHEVWAVSALEIVGWVPRPQGPLEACPGFEYIATAPGPCRLINLEPYVTQGYIIEASNLLFRFYTNDALLTDVGGPVTLEHPYSYAQVLELDYEPSNDVLYLYHGDVPTKLLARESAAEFVLEDFEYLNGPFEDRNENKTLTVTASNQVGPITLSASAPLFEPGDVGGLFLIQFIDLADIRVWEPGMTVAAGGLCQWDGKVYRTPIAGRTGSFAPSHFEGSEYDGLQGTDINAKGPYGVSWEYQYDAYGQLKITGYISPTVVSCDVQRTLASTGPQWRWRFGAFSPRRGYPEHGAIFNERHVVAKGDTRYLSQVGLLNDFSIFNEFGDIGDDQAIVSVLNNTNPIQWLHSSSELFTGSATHESTLRAASAAKGIAPGNTRNVVHTSRGSAAVRPVDHDGRPIFVQRNGRKILMVSDTQYDRYTVEDLTRYADHIGNSRIIELARQKEPMEILWGVREDGILFGAQMMPEEAVLGFFRRKLGGGMLGKTIATVTSPDGRHEDLWLAATMGANWFIMKLAKFRNAGESDDTAVMCDAALVYDGVPIFHISLPHLAGQSVQIVADGIWLGDVQLDGAGATVLPVAASRIMAGLPFDAYVRSLPFEGGGDNGPAQMKMGRTGRVYLRLQESLGLKITVDDKAVRNIENQFGNSVMDSTLPFITRDIVMDMVGAHNRINEIRIDRVAPKQSTILAMGQITEKAQR
jgi:hypothetical protein